jgi:hypothetical protein
MLISAMIILGIIAAIVIPGGNSGFVNSQDSNAILEKAQKSLQARENKIEGKFDSTVFQANNLSVIKNVNGGNEIIGFLKNNGKESYDMVTLVATLYDKNNKLIGIDEGIPFMEADVVQPKGVSAFRIPIFSNATNLHHYLVEVQVGFFDPTYAEDVTTPTATMEKPAGGGLKVSSSNAFMDDLGYMHVVGEVQNTTPNPVSFVKATGTFYDKANNVVATDFAYTNPTDLGPGQKAPFEIILTSASVPIKQIHHRTIVASHD